MINKLNISNSQKKLIVYIVLTAVTLIVYWQVNHYDFVNFDDRLYVTENSYIKTGITLNGFLWAFSTTYAESWQPLIWLSFIFDYHLHGLSAGGYHLTNLILHILSTLLLFWLFCRMTGAIWKSAFVAALFALHPLHVESVAWIAERKDVLSAFFWMLTLCLYVYYTEKPAIKRYLLVLFSFVLALMSKPMVITLPAIMILLDYWPLKRFASEKGNLVLWQLKEKTPFFVLSAVLSFIVLIIPYETPVKYFPLSSRIANAPVSFVTYLEKTFFPHDLAFFYPFPDQIPVWQVFGSCLLILLISTIVIVTVKRLPYLFVGWLWYTLALLPVIGIFHIEDFAMADRYTYLPSIGIGIMLAWGIPLLFPSKDVRKIILFPAGIAALAILAVLTWRQCGYWNNGATLFSHALQVTKNNFLAHNNLGVTLFAEGKIKEAIDHYNKALRITPDFTLPYFNRGIAYAKLGQHQSAIEDYNKLIRLIPNYAKGYCDPTQYQLAIEVYNEALCITPDFTLPYLNRGIAYGNNGQKQCANEDFNKTISRKQIYAEAYFNRGIAYANLDRYQRAIENYNEAILLKPDYEEAYKNRANAYFNQGNNISVVTTRKNHAN